jgi:hypothetical protein
LEKLERLGAHFLMLLEPDEFKNLVDLVF